MMWVGAVLGRILVAAAGTEVHDSNAEGPQLLLVNALRHSFGQILHQQPHATVLQKRGVKTHAFSFVKEPHPPDRGSEAVSC